MGVHGVWREAPGLLITVVFATLFLGKEIPGPRRIWEMAAPQATFGQTVARGQYVIGLAPAIPVLTPVFGIHPAAGALIEIGCEGGHGTATGLGATFDELGFEAGRDRALGMADPENRTRADRELRLQAAAVRALRRRRGVTAMSVPLIFAFGPATMLAVSGAVFAAWLIFAGALFRRHAPGRG